jgi:amino acid permease
MDSFDDSTASFSNLIPSGLFENSYILYSLIALILVGVSYLAYKYYFNKNSSIGSTNIDNLQNTNENNNYTQSNNEEQNNEQYSE